MMMGMKGMKAVGKILLNSSTNFNLKSKHFSKLFYK